MSSKWPCTACSYANWPLARKCVLCLTPKDAAVVDSQNGKTKVEVIQPSDNKWSCKICTYDNWPATLRCTMCQEPRYPAEQSQQSGATGQTAESLGACASGGQGGPKNRRKKSRGAEAPHSRDKWQCPVCTYSNYTKTKKCIMCGIAPTPALLRQLSNSSSSSNDSKGSKEELTREPSKRVDLRENYKRELCARSDTRSRAETRREQRRIVYDNDSKKQMRNKVLQEDWLFLHACIGAIEGDSVPVERYISQGGLMNRALTSDESRMLTKDTLSIEQGLTLPHLALKYSHSVARLLLSTQQARSPQPTLKRMPSYESPCTAREIRRLVAGNIRQCTGQFPCYYVCDPVTFVLPSEIQTMSSAVQHQLYNDILDRDVEKVLEEENDIINWNRELIVKFRSRLHALWNRSAGDCLLDSALQATWGVNDRDGCLRRALSNSLKDAAEIFYPRWKEYEQMTAANMHYSLDEAQWSAGWKKIVKLAEQPGSSLEQSHIFGLAHVLRRPIIVYGVKYVHNYTGEPLDFARFEGIYLPLLWDQSFCTKSPIVLGYTRGHFSALVGSHSGMDQSIVLPLVDSQQQLLPVHFLTQIELGQEEELVTEWLDTMTTSAGILTAKQYITSQHILSQHLIDEWLLKYKTIPETSTE